MKNWSLLVLLVGQGQQSQVVERLKEITCFLLRIIARQFEVHTSQKFRHGLQLYSVYSRLWGEEAARTMFANFRRILVFRGRHLLLSAVCFSNFDWEKEKISEEKLHRAANDLDSVGDLCRATVECESCGKRQVIDQQMSGVDYCICSGSLGYTDESRMYDSWEPFIEREHHIVWRQRHHVHRHLYAYKVYGTYDDVSLNAFMEVQLNSDFRTEWDDTALQLRVLDSDQDSNSELVYWLVKFPHFFANRDYVFKRRFTVNEEKKEVVIMSEAITPDYIPEEKGVYRVSEYWSTMVIRACEDVNKPGLEYTLTYFDNPGTSLPQRLTNFIAATGFPSFLKKIHTAALSLQANYEQGRDVYVSLPQELKHPMPKREELFEEPLVHTVTVGEELEVPISLPEELKRSPEQDSEGCTFEELTEPTVMVSKDLEGSVNVTEEFKIHPYQDNEKLMFEEPTEPAVSVIEETEIPVLDISSSHCIANEDTEVPFDKNSFEKDPHISVGKVLDLKYVTEEQETVDNRESTEDSIIDTFLEEDIFESQEIPLQIRNSDTPQEDPCKLSVEVIITSEDKGEPVVYSQHDPAFQSDKPTFNESTATVSDSDRLNKKTTPSQDTALHVHLGNKNIEVDLLEAMEVVAPDLERKTLLLKKIENLKRTKLNSEKQNIIREKLRRLKNKIKSFQEHASEKRKSSLKKMEELEKRGHYDHSFVDEKTLKQLEMLFQAMNDVLQADKDFRTGKSFLKVLVDHCEKDFPDAVKEKSASETSSESSTLSQQSDIFEHGEDDRKYSALSDSEQELQLPTRKKKSKQDEPDKDSRPPNDPPPPTSGRLSPGIPASPTKGIDIEKTVNSEIETYSCVESDSDINENESSVFSQWSSWIFVQYISTLWDSSNVYSSVGSVDMDKNNALNTSNQNDHDLHSESSSKPFIAQIWYIIGLSWIFHSETELINEDDIEQERELHRKNSENAVDTSICDNDSNASSNWYWYPINGLYNVYAWVFSASKKNAQSAQLEPLIAEF